MAIGDVHEVDAATDLFYVDTGMYDTPEYGAVYILDAEKPAIIDTGIGTNYERILDAIETVGIDLDDLEYIIPTHVHLDHAGGAGFIAEATDADVYIHESGAKFLVDIEPLWEGTKKAVGDQIRHYTKPKPVPTDRIEPIHDGATIDLGDRQLRAHHAPGHAFHQLVFHEPEDDVVFTADAAGIYVPQLDTVREASAPPGFHLEGVIEDTRMIARLDPDILCYGHFGHAPADDRLSEYVGVITDWVESVAEKRQELADDEAVIEHFVAENDIGAVWGEKRAEGEVAMNVRGVLHYLDTREE